MRILSFTVKVSYNEKSEKRTYKYYIKHIDKFQYFAYINIDKHLWEANALQSDEKRTAEIFKALCDENRIRILKLLQSGEKCACVLLDDLHITQPTLSHHMKILCDSGIVVGRKEGKWIYYSISQDGSAYVIKCLQELTKVTDTDMTKPCCEK